MIGLAQNLRQSPYVSYAYSYPHKTAYRPLPVAVRLEDVWSRENKDSLFLYIHVPFCEMRCGFCNLFTTTNPNENMIAAYLDALKKQAVEVRRALGDGVRFVRMAIGGGTPTFLEPAELESLFDIAENIFDCNVARVPSLARRRRKQRMKRDCECCAIVVWTASASECRVLSKRKLALPAARKEQRLSSIRSNAFESSVFPC